MGLAIFNFIYNTLLIIREATHFIVGITSSSGGNLFVFLVARAPAPVKSRQEKYLKDTAS